MKVRLNPQVLDQTVESFRTERRQILLTGEDIDDAMAVLRRSWEGGAGAAFQNANTLWRSGFDKSALALQKIMDTLVENKEVQMGAETALQQEIEAFSGPIAQMVGAADGGPALTDRRVEPARTGDLIRETIDGR